jgi:hypothetical protein
MNLHMLRSFLVTAIFSICLSFSGQSFIGSNSKSLEINDPKVLLFKTNNVLMQAGKDYKVEIYADAKVYGYQYTLNFDKDLVEFIKMDEGVVQENNLGFTKLNEGAITCSWNMGEAFDLEGKVLFTMHLKAKKNVLLSEVLSINSRYTKAEAYSENLELMDVQLSFSGVNAISNFKLYQNNPNPFKGITFIEFELPTSSEAILTIQDINGKVVRTYKNNYNEGYNKIEVKDLKTSGVLYYILEVDDMKATKKMIIIE